MNKKGQVTILGLMLWVMVIVYALSIVPFFKDMIVDARSSDNLDCGNSSISMGEAASCLVVDLYLPYFLLFLLIAGAGLLMYGSRT